MSDIESGRSNEKADGQLITRDKALLALLATYVVIIVLMFIVPRIAAANVQADGLTQIAVGIGYVFLFGGIALVVSTVSLVYSFCKWPRLSQPMKIVGIMPLVVSVVIIVAIALLISMNNGSATTIETPVCTYNNGTTYPCPEPVPKNETYPGRW